MNEPKYIRVHDLKKLFYELGVSPKIKKSVLELHNHTSTEIMARQWVPVSERLPEANDSVWGWSEPLHDLTITCLDDFFLDGITHWMPLSLPEPPKEANYDHS